MITVLSREQMRKSDAYTVENITPERQLIKKAAEALLASAKYTPPVCVMCGGGNNGADGLALSLLLHKDGIIADVCLVSEHLSDEGEYFLSECKSAKIPVMSLENVDITKYKTVVDCILGTGFSGKLRENAEKAIKMINDSGAYVISADINSGLDSNGGMGDVCVLSDITVALGEYKYGHFLSRAKDVMKSKTRCDVGIKVVENDTFLIEKSDVMHLFNTRKNYSHKGVYGYVTVIGGSVEYSGAAKLANISMCALRSGCGVCRLAVPENIAHSVMPYLLESTLCPLKCDENGLVFDEASVKNAINGSKCVSFGMGMKTGKEQKKMLAYILENYRGRLIIDADGLNNLADMDREYLLETNASVILTPHVKEFSRLSGKSCEEILNEPVKYAKEYAEKYGVILLLKGTSTLITDGNTVYITDTGAPGMATAGSGDVLSGILTGIMGFAHDSELLLSTASGAYINGLCGMMAQDAYTSVGMTSSDTAGFIPHILKSFGV